MTPSDIEILIHYHVCPDPHPRIEDAPGIQETIDDFVELGILEPKGVGSRGILYGTTEKGNALVMLLCKTEMPQHAWVDKYGEVILDEAP